MSIKYIAADEVREDIRTYLQGWYDKARARQESKGKVFNISFEEFLTLWGKRRIRSLAEWMDKGTLHVRNRKSTPQDPNANGYVFSPISFAATREAACTFSNMQICTRAKALQDCKMKKGDTHTEVSKLRISQSTKGKAKSEEHRAAISNSMTGIKRAPMSDADRAKKAASAKAYWAKKRADKEAGL